MGINATALGFFKYCAAVAPFGDTATLGRQGFYVSKRDHRYLSAIGLNKASGITDEFCESALKQLFGARCVDSFDNSIFEGATHTLNLNSLQVPTLRYDTVLDIGTSEHVFNITTALNNIANLCRTGGRIIHIVPANNFCGHGFWQFSPELFFHLYSSANGFIDTEIFISKTQRPDKWFRVKPPEGCRRAEVRGNAKLYLLVCTRKQEDKLLGAVQQTDYANRWISFSEPTSDSPQTGPIANHSQLKHHNWYKFCYRYYWFLSKPFVKLFRFTRNLYATGLNSTNPSLTQISVYTLLGPQCTTSSGANRRRQKTTP